MNAANAVFVLILVLLPLSVLAPIADSDKKDLTDFHPQNLGWPRIGEDSYRSPRDKKGRPGLELLQGNPGDFAYEGESAVSVGTAAPGDTITVRGRLFGWYDAADTDTWYTLAGVTIYIFWNTNITTGPWVNNPPYNGITIENGTAAIASAQTNGTANPNSGGEVDTDVTPYSQAGYFEATFNVPDFDNTDYNIQVGNNTITAWFLGEPLFHKWHVETGTTWIDVVGAVELGETPSDATIGPGSNATFTCRATLQGTSTPVYNTSIQFDWLSTVPSDTSISAPGFNASDGNVWRTNSSGYIIFQVSTKTETPFGTYTLNATIIELDPDDDVLYNISTDNYNHSPDLTVQNFFTDARAIVEVTAQPTPIQAGYFTVVTVKTRFLRNTTTIGGVPVNITVTPSVGSFAEHFNDSYIINPGNHPSPKAGWYLTNSSGLISWNFTTFYYDFGNYSIEGPTAVSRGNVQVDAIADYGHWAYGQGTPDYRRFYFMNGTNSPDWSNQFDNSTETTIVNIDNQWEFGVLHVQSIDQNSKIEAGDNWRHLRADAFNRENLSLVLRVYNYNTTGPLNNVNVTFWLNASTGLKLWFWNVSDSSWQDVTSAITSGTTVETDVNGEIDIRINVTATAPKYMKVVLHAYANFTQFPRFRYLNGTKKIGTERISNLTHSLGTPNPWDRGFQINPRYSYGVVSTTVVSSDNDSYALGYSGISTTDGKVRRGNWINLKFQVLNDSQGLANAAVRFFDPNSIPGLIVNVNTAKYPAAGAPYPAGWYRTDSNGFIEVNISTSKTLAPKSLQNVNITANASFFDSDFPYINASSDPTKQFDSLNGTFSLDPQYVYGSLTATVPSPRKVPSGGSNITITFTAKNYAGQTLPRELLIRNSSTTGEIFALVNATAGNNTVITDYRSLGFRITTNAQKIAASIWKLHPNGSASFQIDPENGTTPEGDYYLLINVSFEDVYDGLEYLNGTMTNPINSANATSLFFTIQEKISVSVTVEGTNPDLGQADGLYLVKRGVTQVSLSGTCLDSLGNPQSGLVSIGWNATKRADGSDRIEWYQNVSVTGGTFTAEIVITQASNMPLDNITIFADNATRTNEEFVPGPNSEIITYAQIRLISDISFSSGPSSNRGMVFTGQNCTISGSLVDDTGIPLSQPISPANVRIRAWDGSSFVSGIDFLSPLNAGVFSGENFVIPDDYSQDTIAVVLNISSAVHYNSISSQALIINVYRDVNQGSTSGGPDAQLVYANNSGYFVYDNRYASDSGSVAHNGEVQVYNGTVTIQGWIFDQAGRALTSAYANYANNVSAYWYWNATHQWWENTTTDSTGMFTLSFNNTGPNTWDLQNNGSWTITFYFVTENGTAIVLQTITIAYYMVDFTAPVPQTQMIQGGINVAEGSVVYGIVTLYINATDPGPSDGVVFSGIAADALTYKIDNDPWIPVSAKYNFTAWAIIINADDAAYDTSENHTVFINVTDKNGNVLTYNWTFLVDITPPNITANQADGIVLIGTGIITFTIEENTVVAGYTALDISTIFFDIDSLGRQSGAANFTGSTLTLTISTTGLSAQEDHTVQVLANDSAGNQGTLTFNFKIDRVAPLISWGTQTNGSRVYTGVYLINITITDPAPAAGINDSAIIAYVDNPSNNLATPVYDPSTGYYETIWNTTGYAVGAHILNVVVSDNEGNQNTSSLRVGLVKITSPEAQGIPLFNLTWIGYLGTATGEEVNIRVEDPLASGSVEVTIISYYDNSQLGSISLSLSETSPGSGIFTEQLFFSLQGSSESDRTIQVFNGINISITHSDLINDSRKFVAAWFGGTTGSISVDEEAYQNGDIASVTVTDLDGNLDPNLAETLTVTVLSDSDSSGISVTLQETGLDTGVFVGEVKFVTGDSSTSAAPRELKIDDGDTIVFNYRDTMNDTGQVSDIIVTASASVEKLGDGDDIMTSILLLAILSPLALGGGIGAAILFERLREMYFSS